MKVQAISFVWFQESDWETWKTLIADRDWHDSFADWCRDAEQAIRQPQASGIIAVKADVRPDAFRDWCTNTGRHIDNRALLDFANDVASRAYLGDKSH